GVECASRAGERDAQLDLDLTCSADGLNKRPPDLQILDGARAGQVEGGREVRIRFLRAAEGHLVALDGADAGSQLDERIELRIRGELRELHKRARLVDVCTASGECHLPGDSLLDALRHLTLRLRFAREELD